MVNGAQVYTYIQLSKMLKASRNGQVKLAHNTIAHFLNDNRIGIRLYYTDVVIVNPDDTYQLHSQGYTTATTRDRLNGFSPAKVVQKDFTFYVLKDPSLRAVKSNLVEFQEGITVDRYGNVNSVTA